jgi:hypothetical protein
MSENAFRIAIVALPAVLALEGLVLVSSLRPAAMAADVAQP